MVSLSNGMSYGSVLQQDLKYSDIPEGVLAVEWLQGTRPRQRKPTTTGHRPMTCSLRSGRFSDAALSSS